LKNNYKFVKNIRTNQIKLKMARIIRTVMRYLLLFIVIMVLTLITFLLVISITNYKPEKVKNLNIICDTVLQNQVKDEFSFLTWNIGYAGLGENMDFFYDGGEMVMPEKTYYNTCWYGIKEFLKTSASIDFILLQEVDFKSKRSYFSEQNTQLNDLLELHCVTEVVNYNVRFVPVPLNKPLGKVFGGMMTFSLFTPSLANRVSFPEIAPWPQKLFLPDRCFIETRFRLQNGKELIVLNTHQSFYIKTDSLRNKELEVIKNKMISEYINGNYVVAGGDWNQNPPDIPASVFSSNDIFKPTHISLQKSLLPSQWKYAYDATIPTNRDVDQVYSKGITPTTIIDFFIVSPNIEVLVTKTTDMGFRYSDHQPVYMKIRLLSDK